MVAPFVADELNELMYPAVNLAMSTLRLVDHDVADSTAPAFDVLSAPASDEMTAEVDGATEWLGVAADEILLAALGRTIARTIGEGVVAVDVTGEARWLLHAIPLTCATAQQASPTEMLGDVHRLLAAGQPQGPLPRSETFVNYVGTLPDGTRPTYETHPALGYALELRVYRTDGLLRLDWWFDTNRFDRYTVEELIEQFPLALFEMTSDAAAPV
ncbi:MAG TPA: hypothetical protein VMS92_15330 [Mycobacterium sp.]|nr:hypothetical protein [Mycobacterium sp.]